MSCNPAIGGQAKGQIVREIDALGGMMGLNTDATTIQFRMLNSKKGPSVRSPRAQCDKKAYQFRAKAVLERQPHLDLKQGNVVRILTGDDGACGVETNLGLRVNGRAVVITTGTFMRGLLHVGLQNQAGGRMGDSFSTLSDSLKELGFEVGRFKTGTPCRLHGKTIDFTRCERQDGDRPAPFSFSPEELTQSRHDIFSLNHWKEGVFHVEQLRGTDSVATRHLLTEPLERGRVPCGTAPVLGDAYEHSHARFHSGQLGQVPTLCRANRGRRAAILPFD
jgi:tRNA uridine 5-carboxymethylaminomethyl modification enzyme